VAGCDEVSGLPRLKPNRTSPANSCIVFTIIYCLEAAAKIVAYGFKLYISKASRELSPPDPSSYRQPLTHPFLALQVVNVVDLVVVAASVLELVLKAAGVPGAIQALRAVQPLKVVTESQNLREV